MSQKISLKTLIATLARSFVDAQEHIAWTQLLSIQNYFHKNGSPKTIDIKVPISESAQNKLSDGNDIQTDNSEDSPNYSIPLLSIAPVKPLNIKEAQLEFSVGISEIDVDSTLKDDPSLSFLNMDDLNDGIKIGSVPQDLFVDIKSLTTSKVGNIKVNLKIESSDVEDGYARLINTLSQLQGDWKTHK